MPTMTSPGRSPPIAAGLLLSTELTSAPAGVGDGATGDAGDEVVVAVRVGAEVAASPLPPETPSHPWSTAPDETSWRTTPRTSSAGRKTDRVEAPDCVTCSRIPETLPLWSRSGHPMSSAARGAATVVPAKPEVTAPPPRGRPEESTVPAYALGSGVLACGPGSMATAMTGAPTTEPGMSQLANSAERAMLTTIGPSTVALSIVRLTGRSIATGVVAESGGIIVTTSRALLDARSITVIEPNGSRQAAEVIDLA